MEELQSGMKRTIAQMIGAAAEIDRAAGNNPTASPEPTGKRVRLSTADQLNSYANADAIPPGGGNKIKHKSEFYKR